MDRSPAQLPARQRLAAHTRRGAVALRLGVVGTAWLVLGSTAQAQAGMTAIGGITGLDWPAWSQRAQALAVEAAQAAARTAAASAQLATSHSPHSHAALSALELRIEARAGQPDPRLQLAPCQAVDVYLPAGHKAWGSTRVGVRCLKGSVRWNVSLPVQVQVWAPAWRTRSTLPAGTLLAADHLERASVDWAAADTPPFADDQALLGRSLLRGLPAGHTLREVDLKRRQWFAVGDIVQVVATGPSYRVSADATALTPGIEGQAARARTESGRVVSGIATAQRRLEVPL